jgi:iron complex transport system ATP-binding protein
VTHHLEEIPAGFGHGLALAHGRVVAAGQLDDVLRDDALTATYGIPVNARLEGGRWSATMQG